MENLFLYLILTFYSNIDLPIPMEKFCVKTYLGDVVSLILILLDIVAKMCCKPALMLTVAKKKMYVRVYFQHQFWFYFQCIRAAVCIKYWSIVVDYLLLFLILALSIRTETSHNWHYPILGTALHKGKEEKLEKRGIERANMKRNPQYAIDKLKAAVYVWPQMFFASRFTNVLVPWNNFYGLIAFTTMHKEAFVPNAHW